MPAAAGEAGGVSEVTGAGALGVQGVLGVFHGAMNHLGVASRTTPDGSYCRGLQISSGWAGDVFCVKREGDQSGLRNHQITNSLFHRQSEAPADIDKTKFSYRISLACRTFLTRVIESFSALLDPHLYSHPILAHRVRITCYGCRKF